MNIGEEMETIVIEPIESPVPGKKIPAPEPEHEKVPVRVREVEKEEVPA